MQPTATRPDRTIIAILALIATIIVIAVVVVFTRGGPAELDPSTPEGVVQSYTNAVVADDDVVALDFLTASVRENCDHMHTRELSGLLMTVDSTRIRGDRAIVAVTMEQSPGGGLYGGSRYVFDEKFTLAREGNLWKVDSAPWDLMVCYNQGADK